MNANPVAKNYALLTPEERFRLILAARGRGDDPERERLTNTSPRIFLTMSDFSPHAHAFGEVALLIFVELLEEAARYLEALDRADSPDLFEHDEAEEEGDDAEPEEEPADRDRRKKSVWQ